MVTKCSPPQTGHAWRVAVRGVPTPCSEDFGSGVRLGNGATSQNRIATDQRRATRHGWPTARCAAMSLTRMETRPTHEQRGSTTQSASAGACSSRASCRRHHGPSQAVAKAAGHADTGHEELRRHVVARHVGERAEAVRGSRLVVRAREAIAEINRRRLGARSPGKEFQRRVARDGPKANIS